MEFNCVTITMKILWSCFLPMWLPSFSSISTALSANLREFWLRLPSRSDKKVTTMASKTLKPTRAKMPTQKLAGNQGQKREHLQLLWSQTWPEDSPIIGRLSSVDGRMSFRINSKTEMDNSMVILKPSFSPRASLMKKEAKSRTSR